MALELPVVHGPLPLPHVPQDRPALEEGFCPPRTLLGYLPFTM